MQNIRDFIDTILLAEMTTSAAASILKRYGADDKDLTSIGVKQLRRKLNKAHHPDVGGNLADIQMINAACDTIEKSGPVPDDGYRPSGFDRTDPFGFGFEKKPGRHYDFWGDDITDDVNLKTEQRLRSQQDKEGLWAYAGLPRGSKPTSTKIVKNSCRDLNYIKREAWLKSNYSKDVFVVTAYDNDQGFATAFAVFSCLSEMQNLAGDAVAYCELNGLSWPSAIFISPDRGETEYLVYLNGRYFDDPKQFRDGIHFKEAISLDTNFMAALRCKVAADDALAEGEDGDELSKGPRELDEGSRIGSAVTLRDIPERFRDLPVLGRGTTTIALDLDASHVILLVRDPMKVEWLQDQGLADTIDRFEAPSHIRGMHDIDVVVMKCLKLRPLSRENKRLATGMMREFERVRRDGWDWKYNKASIDRHIISHYTSDEKHRLYNFFSFLANYDSNQYLVDLGNRNFMETPEGEIVVLDPVVSKEVVDLINRNRSEKAGNRYYQ